ncbi:hypothetical protein [Pseudoduganella chitinolytica]|uniref:Uncharacterized protein n=1 Tax=Pseudoduganella chitinolytica TaxID=34070 RepID=A0ABY8BIH6_9BURK|nr:hypothetical protein [Pseudoduganella chitinolytica]WEF34074.1 hypothetical protein PX653_04680 [Pseudoduganella chitinolytica]
MHTISLSEIRHIEYEEEGLGEYRWTHPQNISGYDLSHARTLAAQRDLGGTAGADSSEDDFEDTPDTLITDYLARCLELRNSYIKTGTTIPDQLAVTPLQYIDALLYLITALGSSYACHILGATHFHDDTFLTPRDAKPLLERLKSALRTSEDKRAWALIRDLALEIFHLGYPWTSAAPRFNDVLTKEENQFLQDLLRASPSSN